MYQFSLIHLKKNLAPSLLEAEGGFGKGNITGCCAQQHCISLSAAAVIFGGQEVAAENK